jgi:pyruvate/2-oxoacid:ferredoxin oxidoreductase alpha subunit
LPFAAPDGGLLPDHPADPYREPLGELVKSGGLANCEYINVESEFAALSACIGASAMGARTYTATASQGLLYMMEAVYNTAGLGLPVVMTLGNRAIGAPINIWNDHEEQAQEFEEIFGRDSGGLVMSHFAEDAETVIVTLGSVIGTIKAVISELQDQGVSIGALTIRSMRPFPKTRVGRMMKNAKRVVVLEKALAAGIGGILAQHVRWSLGTFSIPIYSVIAGLGGCPITRPSLRRLLERAVKDQLEETHILDLNVEEVDRELARQRSGALSGPAAENILRDIGAVRAAKTG